MSNPLKSAKIRRQLWRNLRTRMLNSLAVGDLGSTDLCNRECASFVDIANQADYYQPLITISR
jgi:hypothetical protein